GFAQERLGGMTKSVFVRENFEILGPSVPGCGEDIPGAGGGFDPTTGSSTPKNLAAGFIHTLPALRVEGVSTETSISIQNLGGEPSFPVVYYLNEGAVL